MKKRLISCFVTLCFFVFLIPAVPASASVLAEYDSSKVGTGLSAVLSDDGTMTILGSGAMKNWDGYSADTPWNEVRKSIKRVVISGDISRIGKYFFNNCDSLISVSINSTCALSVEMGAFTACDNLRSISIHSAGTTLQNSSLSGASALRTLTFSGTVTSINNYYTVKSKFR